MGGPNNSNGTESPSLSRSRPVRMPEGSLLSELFAQQEAEFEAKLQRHHADLAWIIKDGQRRLEEKLENQPTVRAVPLGHGSKPKTVARMPHPTVPPPHLTVLPPDDPRVVQQSLGSGAPEAVATVESQKSGVKDAPARVLTPWSKKSTGIVQKLTESELKPAEEIPPGTCRSRARDLLSGKVGYITNICILANTITMFVQLHYLGELANASLGLDHNDWPGAVQVFYAIEIIFATIFLAELLLNLYVYHCSFFKQSAFNTVDAVIVMVTSLEVFILTPLASKITNLSFMRILRLAKFARAFKVVRTLKTFESLRVLLATILYSITSMFWAMAVMFIFMLMCAIFLCQTLHESILNESLDHDVRLWMNSKYGTGAKSLYTVFEMTFSGCWPNFASPVVRDVNPMFAVFFVVYITFVVFAMIRIISALFLKETLAQASRDAEMMVRERSKKTATLGKELSELFESADSSGDGMVDLEELHNILLHPKVKLWMSELGVSAEDSEHLFELLDDGDGTISCDDFVRGISKLKGEARAQDLVPVVSDCKRILQLCRSMQQSFDEVAHKLGPPKVISLSEEDFPR